jgi:ectoine hydroxylase-related dioxygenase (phytanoyl-CoA dioxygenase family)
VNVDKLKAQFDADGVLKIEALLSPESLRSTEVELGRYIREVVPSLPASDVVWEQQPLPDGSRQLRNLWRMEQHEPYFAEIARTPELLRLAGALVNGEAVPIAVELFAKPAQVGSAVPYHQDNAYFNLVPPDAFTCWIALDRSTKENGCVYYCRGSHRDTPLPHVASGVAGNSMMAKNAPSGPDEITGLLEPGDAMLHHCLTLHRSEPNRSAHARRGLLIVFRGAHCRTDAEGARTYAAVRQAEALKRS